ncbi:hypothetical protein ADK57_11820 [Streptomyces sp. MMG1533]|nr:hypothetical protein ADK57_11820 [Streptomyces sp. MMG1533]
MCACSAIVRGVPGGRPSLAWTKCSRRPDARVTPAARAAVSSVPSGRGRTSVPGSARLGRLPGPVADRGHDHLDAREGDGGQGVEESGEVSLRVRLVDDDAELGHRGGLLRLRRLRSGRPLCGP